MMIDFKPLLVCGIAGGSASGKTTVVRKIVDAFPPSTVSLLDQDSYYVELSDMPLEERRHFNYDHPAAFDTDLLMQHVWQIKKGEAINKPVYSFEEYNRTARTTLIEPAPIVIIEGIMALWDDRLRSLMDIKLYVDSPDDIRLLRRIERDVEHRGRSLASVREQYYQTVRPMHISFVEPTKQFADIIIPEGGFNDVAISMVIDALQSRLVAAGRK